MRVKHRHFRPPLRGAAVALTAGAAATVAVAWACATWAPTRVVEDPMDDPAAALETVDPDGARALHFRQRAFGWTYSCLRGERVHSDSRGTVHLIWAPPYGGVDHQIAGWPLPALRSRVEVLDSQGPGRSYVDGADPVPIRQRRRWELPADEIYH